MPKQPPSSASLDQVTRDLEETSGKLLETGNAMSSFAAGLEKSGFHDFLEYVKRPWRAAAFHFFMGAVYGVGFFVGATVIVGTAIWVMTGIVSQFPVVGGFFETVQEYFTPKNLRQVQTSAAETPNSFGGFFDAFKANVLERQEGGEGRSVTE
jgi:hypothetical protein